MTVKPGHQTVRNTVQRKQSKIEFLRSVAGKTKGDKSRNTVIRGQTKTTEIKTERDINELWWFRHVDKMNNNRIAESVYNINTQGQKETKRQTQKEKWEEDYGGGTKAQAVNFYQRKQTMLPQGGLENDHFI